MAAILPLTSMKMSNCLCGAGLRPAQGGWKAARWQESQPHRSKHVGQPILAAAGIPAGLCAWPL